MNVLILDVTNMKEYYANSVILKQTPKESICFITGPRPKNLPSGSYDPYESNNKQLLLKLREVLLDYIDNKGVSVFVIGMALGIDLWTARMLMKFRESPYYSHIKIIAALPTSEPNPKWNRESIEEYNKVLINAAEIVPVYALAEYNGNMKNVSVGQLMNKRNEFMVDISGCGIGINNGKPGGTRNCLNYANKKGLSSNISLINTKDLSIQTGL